MQSYTPNKDRIFNSQGHARVANSDKHKNAGILSDELAEVNKNYSKSWISIEERYPVQLILESFIDEDKRKILVSVADKSLSLSDILKTCKIPRTSGYRKINSLLKNGFLQTAGMIITSRHRKRTYRSIFTDVIIRINENKITIKVKFAKI